MILESSLHWRGGESKYLLAARAGAVVGAGAVAGEGEGGWAKGEEVVGGGEVVLNSVRSWFCRRVC